MSGEIQSFHCWSLGFETSLSHKASAQTVGAGICQMPPPHIWRRAAQRHSSRNHEDTTCVVTESDVDGGAHDRDVDGLADLSARGGIPESQGFVLANRNKIATVGTVSDVVDWPAVVAQHRCADGLAGIGVPLLNGEWSRRSDASAIRAELGGS